MNNTLSLPLHCLSLCSLPPHVTVEKTGAGQARQLMMKYDPGDLWIVCC